MSNTSTQPKPLTFDDLVAFDWRLDMHLKVANGASFQYHAIQRPALKMCKSRQGSTHERFLIEGDVEIDLNATKVGPDRRAALRDFCERVNKANEGQ